MAHGHTANSLVCLQFVYSKLVLSHVHMQDQQIPVTWRGDPRNPTNTPATCDSTFHHSLFLLQNLPWKIKHNVNATRWLVSWSDGGLFCFLITECWCKMPLVRCNMVALEQQRMVLKVDRWFSFELTLQRQELRRTNCCHSHCGTLWMSESHLTSPRVHSEPRRFAVEWSQMGSVFTEFLLPSSGHLLWQDGAI